MTKTLRDKLDKIGAAQKKALRAAILEMRREGVELTRDRLRDRAQVDNNAATVVLAAFRAGAFEVLDEAPPAQYAYYGPEGKIKIGLTPPAPKDAHARCLRLGPGAIADLEAERYPMPCSFDDMEPQGLELSILSHLSELLSKRRKRAVLRFIELMGEAEKRDLPGLDGDGDLDEQLAELELDPWTNEPTAGDADAGLRALEGLGLDDLGPAWDAACRGKPIKGPQRRRLR